jgi:hypothetical protein
VCAIEEVRHRLGVISQRLLLYGHAAFRQPWVQGAYLGQLMAPLYEAWRLFSARAPPGFLLDGQIPHEAGVRAMTA